MFVRLFRPQEGKEVLLNISHVSRIEVGYAIEGNDGKFWKTSLESGVSDPDATRLYRIFVDGEEFFLRSNPNDPVMKVFDDIYKSAIKGEEESQPAD